MQEAKLNNCLQGFVAELQLLFTVMNAIRDSHRNPKESRDLRKSQRRLADFGYKRLAENKEIVRDKNIVYTTIKLFEKLGNLKNTSNSHKMMANNKRTFWGPVMMEISFNIQRSHRKEEKGITE